MNNCVDLIKSNTKASNTDKLTCYIVVKKKEIEESIS